MMIEISLWNMVTLLLSFFGFVAGMAKYLLAQMEKRQAERDETQDARWVEAQRRVEAQMSSIEAKLKEVYGEWSRLERDFLHLKADLPIHYVRRDDYIRGQSVIEARLDALYTKLELMQLKGANSG